MGRIATSCAFVLTLALTGLGPAAAQTPEADAGLKLAQQVFRAADLEGALAEELRSAGKIVNLKARPAWDAMLVEAVEEELRHDMPLFERLLARALTDGMTVEEIKAGEVIMGDPFMQGAIRANIRGGLAPSGGPSRGTERVASSRAGQSFLRKLGGFGERMKPYEEEFIAELLPGAFRRFADKAEAAEAQRPDKPR
ncbi:MAG: hypothetical protein AB1942_05275 [Pseudomonadota bacterium]